MTIREILHHPDERLRKKAESVTVYDGELETLVADMFETMYAAPGIGLAATQVNIHKRIIALQVAETFSAEQASEAHKKLEFGGTHGRCVIML